MKLAKAMIGGLLLAVTPLAAMADDMSLLVRRPRLRPVRTSTASGRRRTALACAARSASRENWFAFARLHGTEASRASISTTLSVGVGGHYGLTDNLDLVGRVGYFEVNLDAGGGANADDNGYLLDAGLRGRVGDAVEPEGGVHYTDLSDAVTTRRCIVGGRFHFNKTWALGAEYRAATTVSSIFAYVRASF